MKILRKIMAVLVLLGVLGAIVWCAAVQSPDMQRVNWMPFWLGKWANENPRFQNFPAFGLLSFVGIVASSSFLSTRDPRDAILLVGISALSVSALGATLEVAQIWIPSRSFDPYDIAWSIAGAFAGALICIPFLLPSINKSRHG